MLPRHARFVRETFPKGRSTERHTFSWGAVSVYNLYPPRAAVVISKKTLRRAHERNRARRRIFEALAKAPEIKKSLLIYPRGEALTAPFSTIVHDLQTVFSR
jgi:ribonuclease P protein component